MLSCVVRYNRIGRQQISATIARHDDPLAIALAGDWLTR
jgi:hypothetical protein